MKYKCVLTSILHLALLQLNLFEKKRFKILTNNMLTNTESYDNYSSVWFPLHWNKRNLENRFTYYSISRAAITIDL